jgi:hypothetical protein
MIRYKKEKLERLKFKFDGIEENTDEVFELNME